MCAPTCNVVIEDAHREHSGAVFGLARRLLGDRSLAEEVTQEVLLRLSHPNRIDPTRGVLRTLLLIDCHGRSIDAIPSESLAAAKSGDSRGLQDSKAAVTLGADVCDHRQIAACSCSAARP